MKLLSSSIVLLVLVGFASAQFNPLQELFGNLGEAGNEIMDGFEDVLKDANLTVANLTKEMIDDIRNVTQELVEVMMNPVNTFKVKLNENVIQPFTKGLQNIVNPDRKTSDKKYDYDYVNYVTENDVSPVKDQGQCGSCYAFAAVAAVESLYRRKKLGTNIFSEQQIVDCTIGLYGDGPLNNGCSSGTPEASLHYFNDYEVQSAQKYPYKAKVDSCAVKAGPSHQKFNFTTFVVDNEDHLARILNDNGPVVVYIYAGTTFNYYAGGIYNDFITSKKPVDHAVLVVGIGKDWLGREYWLIKNSWGPKWGENGYIRFAKGYNIANMITNIVTIVNLGPIVV